MTKEELIQTLYAGVKDDMKFMYQNAGLTEDEVNTHLMQGEGAFLYLCNNIAERLIDKGIITL